MRPNLAEITDAALLLPEQEQLRLARTLLERAEAVGGVDVEAAWEDEIESRIKLLDSGLAKGRPFAEVLKDIDCQLAGACRSSRKDF
jgi:hypothetical protein